MSTVNEVNKTANQLHTDYDLSKIFIWNNRYQDGTLENATGGALDFAPGTLLGRITSSGNLVPCTAGASDGSEVPVGILKSEVIQLGAAGTKQVSFCVAGDVAAEKIILDGSDTLDTDYNGRILRDRLYADTMGIKAVEGTELTEFDNQ